MVKDYEKHILNNKELFNIYTRMEIEYDNLFSKQKEKNINIYPKDWYKIIDYKIKIKILAEAISNNLLIEKTEEYTKYKKD